jgi:hypothetical protein
MYDMVLFSFSLPLYHARPRGTSAAHLVPLPKYGFSEREKSSPLIYLFTIVYPFCRVAAKSGMLKNSWWS